MMLLSFPYSQSQAGLIDTLSRYSLAKNLAYSNLMLVQPFALFFGTDMVLSHKKNDYLVEYACWLSSFPEVHEGQSREHNGSV